MRVLARLPSPTKSLVLHLVSEANMSKRKLCNEDVVSATELAQMGFCEKRMLLAHRLGERSTPAQRMARLRGQAAHQQYFEEGAAAAADRRCFVATFVFGPDAQETAVLRAFRDTVLLPRWWGPLAVAAYYRAAPSVCTIMARLPFTSAWGRWVLRAVVAQCRTRGIGGGRRS